MPALRLVFIRGLEGVTRGPDEDPVISIVLLVGGVSLVGFTLGRLV